MGISKRPDFSKDLSVKEFEKHYWYRKELIDICRKYDISSSGTKAELEVKIKKLLNGESIPNSTKSSMGKRTSKEPKEITLDTKLVPDGFKFNQKAREFFAAYYKQKKFSFTKEMAAALRKAKRQDDQEMTVADLLKVYEGRKKIENPDEKSYQWNKFVKDFNKDPNSLGIKKDRMKVAALLWKRLREAPGQKEYSSKLLEDYLKIQKVIPTSERIHLEKKETKAIELHRSNPNWK